MAQDLNGAVTALTQGAGTPLCQPSCKCVYTSETRINQGFSGIFGFSAR